MASVKPITPLEQRLGPGMDRRIERPRLGVWPVALAVLDRHAPSGLRQNSRPARSGTPGCGGA